MIKNNNKNKLDTQTHIIDEFVILGKKTYD